MTVGELIALIPDHGVTWVQARDRTRDQDGCIQLSLTGITGDRADIYWEPDLEPGVRILQVFRHTGDGEWTPCGTSLDGLIRGLKVGVKVLEGWSDDPFDLGRACDH
jgi:hypothetical protein